MLGCRQAVNPAPEQYLIGDAPIDEGNSSRVDQREAIARNERVDGFGRGSPTLEQIMEARAALHRFHGRDLVPYGLRRERAAAALHRLPMESTIGCTVRLASAPLAT